MQSSQHVHCRFPKSMTDEEKWEEMQFQGLFQMESQTYYRLIKKIRREQISYSVKVMIISRIHFLIQKCEIWSFLFVTIYLLLGVGSVSSHDAAFLYPAFTK